MWKLVVISFLLLMLVECKKENKDFCHTEGISLVNPQFTEESNTKIKSIESKSEMTELDMRDLQIVLLKERCRLLEKRLVCFDSLYRQSLDKNRLQVK